MTSDSDVSKGNLIRLPLTPSIRKTFQKKSELIPPTKGRFPFAPYHSRKPKGESKSSIDLMNWKQYAEEYRGLGIEISTLAYKILEEGDGSVTGEEGAPKKGLGVVEAHSIDKMAITRLLEWVKERSCSKSEERELETLVQDVNQYCPSVPTEGKTRLAEFKVAISILREVKTFLTGLEVKEGEYAQVHEAAELYPELLADLLEVNEALAELEEMTGKDAPIQIKGRNKPTTRKGITRLLRFEMPQVYKEAMRKFEMGGQLEIPEINADQVFESKEAAVKAIQKIKATYLKLFGTTEEMLIDAGLRSQISKNMPEETD